MELRLFGQLLFKAWSWRSSEEARQKRSEMVNIKLSWRIQKGSRGPQYVRSAGGGDEAGATRLGGL